MDKVLYLAGAFTIAVSIGVMADNIRNLQLAPRDEMPIVVTWIGGWLIIGMGGVIRAIRAKA